MILQKDNLARIRDNQRRSRARRKEYLQELETKFRNCEQLGVEASAEIQAAARRVLEENKKLRALLLSKGVSEAEVDGYITGSSDWPHDDPPAIGLAELLANRKTCSGKRGCEATRPVSMLQPTRSTGSLPLASGAGTGAGTGAKSGFRSAPGSESRIVGVAPSFTPLSMAAEPMSPLTHSQGWTHGLESTGQMFSMPQPGDMASPGSTITPPDVPTPTTVYSFGQVPVLPFDATAASNHPRLQQPEPPNPSAYVPNPGAATATTATPYVPAVEYDRSYHPSSVPSDMTSTCTYASEILQRMNPDIEPELESHLGCNPQYTQCRVENTKLFGLINDFDERR